METRITSVADGIHQLTTYVAEIDFGFNQYLYDETTKTLFCGDLFSQWGAYPATTTDDVAARAIADADSSWLSLAPSSGDVVRRLADLDVAALTPMHGPAFTGDCRAALLDLADDLDQRVAAAT
jgi:hypothetical protein